MDMCWFDDGLKNPQLFSPLTVAQSQKRNGQIGDAVNHPRDDANRTAQDALMYWTRSAAQGDVDAMVKLGDFYYHGWGIDEPATLRYEKAAGYYQAAIDSHSAIAMWNVGWMYENGIGVPQVSTLRISMTPSF